MQSIQKRIAALLAFSAILVAGLVPASAATAQPAIPPTPAGQALSAWLQAFNSGDRETYRRFLQDDVPSKLKMLEFHLQLRADTGGFDLREVQTSSEPLKLTALLQERLSDQFGKLTLEVDAHAPNRITQLSLQAIPRPAGFPIPHLSDAQLTAALRSKVQEDTAADRFSGAVLVAKNGKPVFIQAYGLADRDSKSPNTPSTRFRIGSMNKMFTAVAVMQLVQAGKVSLHDPLGNYLTDYPNKDLASTVTIEELLTHTGGTGDIFGPQFAAHRLELRTLADYVNLYGSRPVEFKPGSRWAYSNYGFILLGAVIEKVSGQSYYDYVREHIYAPAGMTSTDSEPEDVSVNDRSVGYTKMNGPQWQTNTGTLPYRGTSAGGGYSTVGDLLRFAIALQTHKLLDAHYTAMLTTGKVDTPDGGRYGFGFEERVVNGTHCFGHNGGAPGMNGALEICPEAGYVIAVLANLDPPAAERISEFAANRLPSPH